MRVIYQKLSEFKKKRLAIFTQAKNHLILKNKKQPINNDVSYLFGYPTNFDGTDDRFCGCGNGNDGCCLGCNGCAWNRNGDGDARSLCATPRLDGNRAKIEDRRGGTIAGIEVAHSLLHVSKNRKIFTLSISSLSGLFLNCLFQVVTLFLDSLL